MEFYIGRTVASNDYGPSLVPGSVVDEGRVVHPAGRLVVKGASAHREGERRALAKRFLFWCIETRYIIGGRG